MRSLTVPPRLPARSPVPARAALSLALLAGIVGASAAARADPEPPRVASLAWIRSPGAEGCIGPRDLSSAVERKLGREAFAAPARANLAIEGRIERDGSAGRWRAAIAVVGERGEVLGVRELGSAEQDCRALDDALALVIALLIDPGAHLESSATTSDVRPIDTAPAPPPQPVAAWAPRMPSPAPTPPSPTPWVPPRAPPPPWRFEGSSGAIGAIGVLPSAAIGVAVKVRVTPPRWPALQLGGAFWVPQRDVDGAVGARFSLGWGSLLACPLGLTTASDSAQLCVGALAGALRAQGLGLAAASPSEQLELGGEAELGYRRRVVGPLIASLDFAVLVPFVRSRFYYADAHGQRRDLFQQAPIAGSLEATLGVAVP